MKIELISIKNGKYNRETNVSIQVTHNLESLNFVAKELTKSKLEDKATGQTYNYLFDCINKYWETLPDDRINYIFSLYKEAYRLLNLDTSDLLSISNVNNDTQKKDINLYISNNLRTTVTNLLDSHDEEDMTRWLVAHMPELGICIPSCFEQEYIQDINHTTSREKTYLVSDYIDLIILVMFLRIAIPILANYANLIKNNYKSSKIVDTFKTNDFKELKALQLIYDSRIYSGRGFTKLLTYIEANLKEENYQNNENIIAGISDDIYFEYLISKILIKKLSINDIRTNYDSNIHLVTFLFNGIIQNVNSNNTATNKKVNLYKLPSENDNKGIPVSDKGKDKNSSLEIYKVKQNVSQGEILELEFSMSNMLLNARILEPDISEEFLMSCIETARALNNQRINIPQVTLLKWIFQPIVSPQGIPYINKRILVDALGVVQAVLWIRGYKHLSLLSTAYIDIDKDIDMSVHVVPANARIPDPLISLIDKYYPFSKDTIKRNNGEKINEVLMAIYQLSDLMSNSKWSLTASPYLIKEEYPDDLDVQEKRVISTKFDIRKELTMLVIELGSNLEYNRQLLLNLTN